MTFTDRPFITLNTIKPSCLFVEAKIGGVLMSFLVDTGSAVTILDDNVFDMLSGIIKPKQLKSVNKTPTNVIRSPKPTNLSYFLSVCKDCPKKYIRSIRSIHGFFISLLLFNVES